MCQNMGRYTDLHLVTKSNIEQKRELEQEQIDWNSAFISLLSPLERGRKQVSTSDRATPIMRIRYAVP